MDARPSRGVAVIDSTLESRMTSSRRSSSSRMGPEKSPRRRIRSDAASGNRAEREARFFTSAASAETEEVGGKGINRRMAEVPGGRAIVTVYRSIGTWDMASRG